MLREASRGLTVWPGESYQSDGRQEGTMEGEKHRRGLWEESSDGTDSGKRKLIIENISKSHYWGCN